MVLCSLARFRSSLYVYPFRLLHPSQSNFMFCPFFQGLLMPFPFVTLLIWATSRVVIAYFGYLCSQLCNWATGHDIVPFSSISFIPSFVIYGFLCYHTLFYHSFLFRFRVFVCLIDVFWHLHLLLCKFLVTFLLLYQECFLVVFSLVLVVIF